jgi:PTH1 family peptidyl-tRNA hydrolase
MALDRLAARLGLTFSRLESKALLAKGTHQGRRVVLAKPQTYMNLSGKAVASLARFYKVPLVQLLVVYDDVDLPFGTLRLRPAGSSGGQRGMESIIENLGSQEFPRLRLGIGRPPGRMEAGDYVLEDFSRQEMEFLPGILDRAVDAIFTFFDEGLVTAMNRFNGLVDEEV